MMALRGCHTMPESRNDTSPTWQNPGFPKRNLPPKRLCSDGEVGGWQRSPRPPVPYRLLAYSEPIGDLCYPKKLFNHAEILLQGVDDSQVEG